MSLTTHIGYGRFQLQDLLFGEEFARFDGSLAKLCEQQPYQQPSQLCNHPYLPDHFEVWVDYGTSNARKVFLHKTALVHALTAEQATTIQARLTKRKENACT
jgi:hypothetical protein